MPSDKITFKGHSGEELAGRLDTPEGDVKAYALFAHCFTCSKDIKAASQIAKSLNAHGYAVLRFDFTGLGQSEGDFANTNFTSNVDDLIKAAEFLETHHQAPQIIIGHSLGGAAVLVAATKLPSVKGVVTVGAPSAAQHVVHNFQEDHDLIMQQGEAEVQLVGRPFTIKKQFIEDLNAQHVDQAITALKRPLLVMHAPTDQTVGIENAGHIFDHAKHPKSFVSLDDADHLLTRAKDALYAGNVIAAWAGRYIN